MPRKGPNIVVLMSKQQRLDDVHCVFERHFTVAQQRRVRTRTHQLTFNSADPGELYDLRALLGRFRTIWPVY